MGLHDCKVKYPVISIITPSLNQGRFIEETIKSVLSQEGDFYLDYIILDGVSTDSSLEIIKKYDNLLKERQYPVKCRGIEYRWISEPDKGQSDAINKGLRMAKGDIVAWLNSDDRYTALAFSNILEPFYSFAKPYIIYGDLNIIDERGTIINHYKSRPYEGMYKLIESCWNTSASFLVQPALFFKKECTQECGVLDEHLHALFDYDFFIRLANRYKFYYINKTLSEFRIHPESKTGYMNVNYILERINVSKRYYGFLTAQEREKMKIDSTRFLIRRLFLKTKQLFFDKELLKLFRCSFSLLKVIIYVFLDKALRRKAVYSIKKHRLKSLI